MANRNNEITAAIDAYNVPSASVDFSTKRKRDGGGFVVDVFLNGKRYGELTHSGGRFASWSFEDRYGTPFFLRQHFSYPNFHYGSLPYMKNHVRRAVQDELNRKANETLKSVSLFSF